MEKSTLPMFHFLFSELIEECYSNYKETGYLERLKKIGSEIGFRLYNQIAIKKYINERSLTASGLVKIVQTKVFKYIFNYEASSVYQATEEKSENEKIYYHVIVDNVSVYITWMPDFLWEESKLSGGASEGVTIFVSGIIEGILTASGMKCHVYSAAKFDETEAIKTEYFIKISQEEYQRWRDQ